VRPRRNTSFPLRADRGTILQRIVEHLQSIGQTTSIFPHTPSRLRLSDVAAAFLDVASAVFIILRVGSAGNLSFGAGDLLFPVGYSAFNYCCCGVCCFGHA
jgi:hypothetical protein